MPPASAAPGRRTAAQPRLRRDPASLMGALTWDGRAWPVSHADSARDSAGAGSLMPGPDMMMIPDPERELRCRGIQRTARDTENRHHPLYLWPLSVPLCLSPLFCRIRGGRTGEFRAGSAWSQPRRNSPPTMLMLRETEIRPDMTRLSYNEIFLPCCPCTLALCSASRVSEPRPCRR